MLFVATVMLLPMLSRGQGAELFVSSETGKITYEEVMEVNGKRANAIFMKAKEWFIVYFRSAKDVVRGEVEPSMIKGTFVTSYAAALGTRQDYSNDIMVRIKDGAIKVTIDNMQVVGGMELEAVGLKMDGSIRKGGMYKKTFQHIELQSRALCESLRDYVLSDTDNW